MARETATYTTLLWGNVRAPVALFKTIGKPVDLPEFDTAGPNGGVLRYETKAEEAAPEPPPDANDPLSAAHAEDLIEAAATLERARDAASPDRSPSIEEHAETLGAPGEFRQVLREEGSGVWVERDEVRRGVRTEGGFVDVTDQLAAIEEATKLDRMEVVGFVDVGRVDRKRITGSYYLGSGGEGAPKVLRLLFEAMLAERRAAIVRWTKRSRQALGVLVADGRTASLVVLQVAFADAVRRPNERVTILASAEVSPREVDAAVGLVRAMDARIADLDEIEDDAVRLRRELREDALGGKVTAAVIPPEPAEEADLLAALEESVRAA